MTTVTLSAPMARPRDPRERLRRWTEAAGGAAAAARLLGCDRSYLLHLLAPGSRRRLGLRVACAIERETAGLAGGPILASEWTDPPARAIASKAR